MCLALLFFIRPNNICFTLYAIICEFLDKEGLKNRIRCFVNVAIGFFIIALLILITAYQAGFLFDMIDATILTNIRYRFDSSSNGSVRQNFIRLTAVGMFSSIIFIADRNKRMTRFTIFISIFLSLVYCTGKSFKHYFLMVIPLLCMGFSLLIKPLFRKSRYAFLALILLPLVSLSDMILHGTLKSIGMLTIECFQLTPPAKITNNLEDEKYIIKTLERTIPNNQRNEIYLYNYWEILYIFQHFRTLPTNKNSTAAINKLARYKHGVDKDIITELNESRPLWFVTNPYSIDGYFHEIIEREYDLMTNKNDVLICVYKPKKE